MKCFSDRFVTMQSYQELFSVANVCYLMFLHVCVCVCHGCVRACVSVCLCVCGVKRMYFLKLCYVNIIATVSVTYMHNHVYSFSKKYLTVLLTSKIFV